jgi:hypothetical protein
MRGHRARKIIAMNGIPKKSAGCKSDIVGM